MNRMVSQFSSRGAPYPEFSDLDTIWILTFWIQPDPDPAWSTAVHCLTLFTKHYYYYNYGCYVFFALFFMQMSKYSNKLLTVSENRLVIQCMPVKSSLEPWQWYVCCF